MADYMHYILAAAASDVDGGHAEETLLGLGAEGWVYVGVSIFFILAFAVGKVHKKIADGLDAQIAEKRKALDEAAAIRSEAEAFLKKAQDQLNASANDAQNIVSQAEAEAATLISNAETEAKALVASRQKMAKDKIAAAERNAVADVRAKAADAAVAAATMIIAEKHDGPADKGLIDEAIGEIGENIH